MLIGTVAWMVLYSKNFWLMRLAKYIGAPAVQAQWPECELQNHGGKRELIPEKVSSNLLMHTACRTHAQSYTITHNNKKFYVQLKS